MRRRTALLVVLACGVAAAPARAADVTYSCAPAPADCGGWHREPVRLTWSVPPEYDTEGCDNRTYSTDTPGVENRCRASNGVTTVDVTVTIRVDRTPPVVTGALPDRPPDHDAWYTHPVGLRFGGADATSGVGSCTALTYAGPDRADAQAAGTCTDAAGNTSEPLSVPLRYDATAPAVRLRCRGADGQVDCEWSTSRDAVAVQLTRARASAPGARTVLYTGTRTRFTDRHAANGRRFVFELSATDAAGNRATAKDGARPGRRLLGPASGARLTAPPLLAWTRAGGARYYNVQLFRGRRKVLSAWPRRAHLQLKSTWRYRGLRRRLRPGVYRWYVWPGRGPLSAHRYGPLIGRRSFRIR